MRWKVGQSLWMVMIDDDSKITMEEYVIRTIRGGKVHAIWKLQCTWGKRSTKSGDFGWLSPIPAWTRNSWKIDGEPWNLHTTKLQAIRSELKGLDIDDFQSEALFEKAKKTLTAMETRNKGKRK